MAFTLPKCGGLKYNTASFKQIGNVITNINATSITGDTVTACGQEFDEAYFKVIGKAMTTPTISSVTTSFAANCSLLFDDDQFAVDTDGAIEYNPDIVTTLTFTTTPTDATVTVVDHNEMVISESSTAGVYPVLIGGSYTYTVSKAGYITETADIEIENASTTVTVELQPETAP